MRARRVATLVLGAVAICAANPGVAEAAGWIRLPNGKFAYQTDYTSSALFTCSRWIIVGSCSAAPNAVTLSNGGAQLTLSWTSNPAPLRTAFARTPPFVLGTLHKQVTGTGPFVLPTLANPKGPLFDMTLDITAAGLPKSGSEAIYFSYVIKSPTSLRVGGSSTRHTLGYVRQNPSTSGAIWLHAQTPSFDVDPGDVAFRATTGISTPEPGTLLLVATGFAGLAGVARRRRR